MYSALKDKTIKYILDYEPTQEQLTDLNCDSYEPYIAPESIDTEEKKKSRVYRSLITSSILEDVDMEGITFTNKEIGDIILERIFGGNPYAESALQAKTSAYLLSVVSGEPNETLLVSIQEKQRAINEVRGVFGLTSIQ